MKSRRKAKRSGETPRIVQSSLTSYKAKIETGRHRVERILKEYAKGTTFFPRSLLADLDRQLRLGRDYVRINDFENIPNKYSLKVPQVIADLA